MAWHEKPMTQKLTTWFIFGVVIALTPFVLELLRLLDRGREIKLSDVLGTGQLLLVCAAIAAGALGELVLVDVPSSRRFAKLVSIGGCVIVVTVASLWFGDITAALDSGEDVNALTVTKGSLWVFAATLMASAGCLALSVVAPPDVDSGSTSDAALQQLRAILEGSRS